jgi:hypothetical protein
VSDPSSSSAFAIMPHSLSPRPTQHTPSNLRGSAATVSFPDCTWQPLLWLPVRTASDLRLSVAKCEGQFQVNCGHLIPVTNWDIYLPCAYTSRWTSRALEFWHGLSACARQANCCMSTDSTCKNQPSMSDWVRCFPGMLSAGPLPPPLVPSLVLVHGRAGPASTGACCSRWPLAGW